MGWRDRAIPVANAAGPSGGWRSRAIPADSPMQVPEQPIAERMLRGIPELVTGPSIGENAWGGGLATKAGAAVAAGAAKATDSTLGLANDYLGTSFNTPDRDKKWSDIYDEMMASDQKAKDDEAKRSPGVAGTKSFMGAMVNPVAKAGKIGQELGTTMSPVIAKYLGIGAEMGISAGGNTLDTLERTRNADEAEDVGKDTLYAEVAMRALPAVIGKTAKTTARLLAGTKGETIDYYRANSAKVNSSNMDNLRESAEATAKEAYADQIAKRQELARFTKSQEDEIIKGSRAASAEAFEPLIASNKEIPLKSIKGNLTQDINQAKFGEALRETPGTAAMQREREFLDATGLKTMRPEEMKRYVMQLDKSLDPVYAKMKAGIPLEEGEKALMAHRRFVDSKLKEIPEYDAAMGPVRDRMRVLEGASPHIGDVDQTYRTLERIDSPTMTEAKKGIEGMFPWQTEARNIPEEAAKINSMNRDLRGVKPENMEAFLNRMTRAKPSAKDTEAFSGLAKRAKSMPDSEVSVKDMEEYLKNLNVKEAFERPYVKGSRNVNLGALSLGGAAQIAADKISNAGTIGAMVGGVLGGAADLAGPQTVKKIIDVIDSPVGKKFQAIYRKAAERGPQAIIMTHELLKQNDPEYRALLNEQSRE